MAAVAVRLAQCFTLPLKLMNFCRLSVCKVVKCRLVRMGNIFCHYHHYQSNITVPQIVITTEHGVMLFLDTGVWRYADARSKAGRFQHTGDGGEQEGIREAGLSDEDDWRYQTAGNTKSALVVPVEGGVITTIAVMARTCLLSHSLMLHFIERYAY